MAKKMGYYPGCSLHSSAKEYDSSVRAVISALGITAREIPDWNCCGASSGHSAGHSLSMALPMRNLMQAEAIGEELLIPCAACYSILRSTESYLESGSEEAKVLQSQVEGVMGRSYTGKVKSIHPLDLLTRPEILQEIKAKLSLRLKGLKLAPYYGCFLVRPDAAAFDNQEQPQKMDQLLAELGASVVRWSYKTECCGGSLGITQGPSTSPLVDKLVAEARKAGAQALVTACPLCQANLEGRQSGTMPVFYFTELVGLALGLPDSNQWFKGHIVDTKGALDQLKEVISGV